MWSLLAFFLSFFLVYVSSHLDELDKQLLSSSISNQKYKMFSIITCIMVKTQTTTQTIIWVKSFHTHQCFTVTKRLRFPLMEILIRDISWVVFHGFTFSLTQSVEQKRPSTHTVLQTAHTLSLYHFHYCGQVSFHCMRTSECVYFHDWRSLSGIMRPCNILPVFQESKTSQATDVYTFLRFRSSAEENELK